MSLLLAAFTSTRSTGASAVPSGHGFVPASNDATLSALTIGSGNLSPAFSAAVTNYTAAVSSSTTTLQITPTVNTPPATVTVNGTPVTSGAASQSITLITGLNNITIVVTAADATSTTTYRLGVTRLDAFNANLSNLELSTGTLSPAFSPSTTSYTSSVPTSVTSLQLTATTVDGAATLKIRGSAAASGVPSASIPLVVGPNSIIVEVNSANLMVAKFYQVTITRLPSSIATLAWISLSDGTMNTPFSSSVTNYTVSVPSDVTWTNVFASPTDAKAKVKINGKYLPDPATSGYTAQLAVGINTISLVVIAENGTNTKTYTIKVTRAKPSDATLSTLTLKTAAIGPKFSPKVFSYKSSVAATKTSVKVRPVSNNTTDTIQVNGKVVKSGSLSGAIALKTGKNVIKIVTHAVEGATQTYKITITRAKASATPPEFAAASASPLVGKVRIAGRTYLQLSITRPDGRRKPVIEVSSDLVHWFSGDAHTTTLVDDGTLVRVRDNTPFSPDRKRYIRIR